MTITEMQKEIDNLKHSSVFFDHVRYLFPIDEEYRWFLQWMAYNIQFPDMRCQVTPLHISREHGTGRGSLTNMIMLLVGHWNCAEAGMGDLSKTNEFTGQFLDKKLIVFVHEVRQTVNRYEIDSNVRSILSDKFLDVNTKYGTRVSQRVFVNFLMFSNHPDALVLTDRDRRMYVLTGPDKPKPAEYYTNLTQWIDDAEEERHLGIPEAYWWLNKIDLSDFEKVRAPLNEARTYMINASASDDEMMIEAFLKANTWPYLTLDNIKTEVAILAGTSEFGDEMSEMSDARFGHILINEGCNKIRQRVVSGNAFRLWAMSGPNVKKQGDIDKGYLEYRSYALTNKT